MKNTDELNKYIEQLKSKQLFEYAITELSDIIEEISDMYSKAKTSNDKVVLKSLYKKVAEYTNERVGRRLFNKTLN